MIRGYVHDDFLPVAELLAKQLEGREGGAAACIYHRGERVVDVWAGESNVAKPWAEDTMALSFSTTKGMMATVVHILAGQGLLDYDQKVSHYWPEFSQAGKGDITVRDVLSHRAGLHPMKSLIDNPERIFDWEFMANALASASPFAEKRGRSGYHGITWGWIVGEIVRRVTTLQPGDALQQILVQPLALDGAYIKVPFEQRTRVATLVPPQLWPPTWWTKARYWALGVFAKMLGLDPSVSKEALMPDGFLDLCFSERMLDTEIPSMNGVFTARSLARVYMMLANGGELDGKRLIPEDTLVRATEVQKRTLDSVVGFPMAWRLGYHLVGTSRGILPNAFGHFGYGGSGAWGDPDRRLSVAMTLSRVAGTPFGDMRMVRLGGVASKCADRRAKKTRS